MGMIWLVTEKRFVEEYANHIRNIPLKYVNWFVDYKTGSLRMYITAQGTNEVYCYVHSGGTDTLSAVLKDMLSEKGMVLGIEDSDDYKGRDNIKDLVNEIKGLKFSQVALK